MKQLLCVAFIALNFVIIHAAMMCNQTAISNPPALVMLCGMKVKNAISMNANVYNNITMLAGEWRYDQIIPMIAMEVNSVCNASEMIAIAAYMETQLPIWDMVKNIVTDVIGNLTTEEWTEYKMWSSPATVNSTALKMFWMMKFANSLTPAQLECLNMTAMQDMMLFFPDSLSETALLDTIMNSAAAGNIDSSLAMLRSDGIVISTAKLPAGWKLPNIGSIPNVGSMMDATTMMMDATTMMPTTMKD